MPVQHVGGRGNGHFQEANKNLNVDEEDASEEPGWSLLLVGTDGLEHLSTRVNAVDEPTLPSAFSSPMVTVQPSMAMHSFSCPARRRRPPGPWKVICKILYMNFHSGQIKFTEPSAPHSLSSGWIVYDPPSRVHPLHYYQRIYFPILHSGGGSLLFTQTHPPPWPRRRCGLFNCHTAI